MCSRAAIRAACAPLLLVIVTAAAVAGCGGGSLPPADRVTQSYLNELGGGAFAQACGHLDARTRRALSRRLGPHSSCPRALSRCTPDRVRVLRQDPTQLLFATIVVHISGSHAVAHVSGTRIADLVRRLTLAHEGHTWRLTSFGERLIDCPRHHRGG